MGSPTSSVQIITKADKSESNTKYAQGGVAAVTDFGKDGYREHIRNTITAGAGLCDHSIVEMVVKDGPEVIKELVDWGVSFDKSLSGTYDLGREGGHSRNRILHHRDFTGLEIERKLLKMIQDIPNIEILSHYFAMEFLMSRNEIAGGGNGTGQPICTGVRVLDISSGNMETIHSKITYLATGGIGQVYQCTTNPTIATGDGLAMAQRAEARIENMEFVQFHPTALYEPGTNPAFLISEAVRGAGAVLRLSNGEAFMKKYDGKESLAPRDIVARAIAEEMQKAGVAHLYLDCTEIPRRRFKELFPTVLKKCLSIGIDVHKKMIPVVPAAHYICGGVKTDKNGRTSIKRLYAGGECASTGLHGANRLASNSLLEALVFAKRSALHSLEQINGIQSTSFQIHAPNSTTMYPPQAKLLKHYHQELQTIMNKHVGIFRNSISLKKAQEYIFRIRHHVNTIYRTSSTTYQLCELYNMSIVACLIVNASISRKENYGAHYNVDNVKLGQL